MNNPQFNTLHNQTGQDVTETPNRTKSLASSLCFTFHHGSNHFINIPDITVSYSTQLYVAKHHYKTNSKFDQLRKSRNFSTHLKSVHHPASQQEYVIESLHYHTIFSVSHITFSTPFLTALLCTIHQKNDTHPIRSKPIYSVPFITLYLTHHT